MDLPITITAGNSGAIYYISTSKLLQATKQFVSMAQNYDRVRYDGITMIVRFMADSIG